jgi:hypothetical protein
MNKSINEGFKSNQQFSGEELKLLSSDNSKNVFDTLNQSTDIEYVEHSLDGGLGPVRAYLQEISPSKLTILNNAFNSDLVHVLLTTDNGVGPKSFATLQSTDTHGVMSRNNIISWNDYRNIMVQMENVVKTSGVIGNNSVKQSNGILSELHRYEDANLLKLGLRYNKLDMMKQTVPNYNLDSNNDTVERLQELTERKQMIYNIKNKLTQRKKDLENELTSIIQDNEDEIKRLESGNEEERLRGIEMRKAFDDKKKEISDELNNIAERETTSMNTEMNAKLLELNQQYADIIDVANPQLRVDKQILQEYIADFDNVENIINPYNIMDKINNSTNGIVNNYGSLLIKNEAINNRYNNKRSTHLSGELYKGQRDEYIRLKAREENLGNLNNNVIGRNIKLGKIKTNMDTISGLTDLQVNISDINRNQVIGDQL